MLRSRRLICLLLIITILISSLCSFPFSSLAATYDITIPEGTFDDIASIESAFKYQTQTGYAPEFSDGAVTIKRADNNTANNKSAGAITHIKTLPAGDYVWQFELTMTATELIDNKYKTACDFGVYEATNEEIFYYGLKGIPVSARYIDLSNIDINTEKNNQRAYCNQIRDFSGTPYFHYNSENINDVNKHYYVLVDFTLLEETEIALSITTASIGYTAKIDNFHLFNANDQQTLNSLEYFFAANSNNNYSISTEENYIVANEVGKYQSLKYNNAWSGSIFDSDVEDSFLYPQPVYSSRNNFYRLTEGNLYKIKFKYKCTDLAKDGLTQKIYPITIYPTCGYFKDSKNSISTNASTSLRFLLNGFDKINSVDNKALFEIKKTNSEWLDAEIEFWAYNANGKDLDLEVSELLSLSVSGKGTVYIDNIEVIDLGIQTEREITVSAGNFTADGNYYFSPYGAVMQNGVACEKNADGKFVVSDGTIKQKLYPRADNGLSVYKVESVERGNTTSFFNTKPGMIFSIFVEDYSANDKYGVLVIRNANESVLEKIDNNTKNDMIKLFIDNNYTGWNDYEVENTVVSFSVIENQQFTKQGDDYCQFDVKVYGNLDSDKEKNGVPYKDMKVSVSAYKISGDNYSVSKGFKSASYSNNIFNEINYNNNAVVVDHTGTGGVLPLYWQYGDDDGKWYTYTQEQLDKCVEQLKKLNVSIVRCICFQPGYAWNNTTNSWDWDTKYMRAFYEYAKTMYENDIDIIINTTVGVVSGTQGGEPLPKALGSTDAEVYPIFVKEFIENVVKGNGIPQQYANYSEYLSNIKYFMYATEPNNGDKTEATDYNPANSEKLINYKSVMQATHNYLTQAGLRDEVKFIGPNTVDHSSDAKTVKWAVENLDDYIDIYAAHSDYSRVEDMTTNQYLHWQNFNSTCKEILSNYGIDKPFWHDEYNIFMISAYGGYDASFNNPIHGTQLATAQLSMMQNGASSSLLWGLFDFKWTNSYRSSYNGYDRGFFKFGLAPSVLEFANPNEAYVYPSYYAYSILGTAIKNGDTVYSGTVSDNGLYTILLKHKDGKYSVVLVNNSSDSIAAKINLPDNANGCYTNLTFNPFGTKDTGYGTFNKTIIFADNLLKTTVGAYQVVVYNLN